MFKNFSPQGLGVSGRQSELIELALTYGFRGLDIDMEDTYRRSLRSTPEDAGRYLRAADIKATGFELSVNIDADSAGWTAELAKLKPIAGLAGKLNIGRAYLTVPAGSTRLAYHEFFEEIQTRIKQLSDLLAAEKLKLALNFQAGADAVAGRQYEFIRNVEVSWRWLAVLVPRSLASWSILGTGTLVAVASISCRNLILRTLQRFVWVQYRKTKKRPS